MTIYINPAIEADPAAIKQTMVDQLEAAVPGLSVDPATWLDFLLDVIASGRAEDRDLITEVTAAIFRWYGQNIVRLTVAAGTPASTTSTWVAIDTAGHTIDAGTRVTLDSLSGEPVVFEVPVTVTIAPGTASTTAGAVTLVAVDTGTDGNGLSTGVQPEQTFNWLDHITIVAATSGGTDPESDDTYLDRLATALQLLTGTLVTADDFQLAAITLGAGRALAVDLYDASTGTPGVGGHETIIVADATGTNLSGGTKTTIQTALQTQAIAGMTVHVVDPTATAVAVVFAGPAVAGYDPATVEADAEAAVQAFLSRALWGSKTGRADDWTDTLIVRYQDLVTVLNNVDGFDHYTTLTVNGGTADITLAGPGGVPTATVTGTVT